MDLLSLLALLFAPSFPLFLPVWWSLMDANGHLLNWISSQDGDKRGTAFFFFFFFPPPPSPSYFERRSVQRCVERTLMRRGEEETPPLLDSFKTLCPRLALAPIQWGKEAAWAPCATTCRCQFSKVPASDAARKKCPIKKHHPGCSGFGSCRFCPTDKLGCSQI